MENETSTSLEASSTEHLTNSNNFALEDTVKTRLKDDFPQVFDLILTLQNYIRKQNKKLRKLKKKFKLLKNKKTSEVGIQVNTFAVIEAPPKSLIENITEAAEIAMQKTGFVYEETSGLYYDYNSGYYYNAELGLYYDGNTGTYLSYNEATKSYSFHSQVETIPSKPVVSKGATAKVKRKKKIPDKRQAAKREKLSDTDAIDLEEGECSNSSHNATSSENTTDNEAEPDLSEIAASWPPCMRIIVEDTTIAKIKCGSLHIITCDGGTVGREGEHSFIIPDINVSKHHLKFTYDQTQHQYAVTDLGSRNGTILNGKRISVSKQESEPVPVEHGSRIQLGSTTLLCHIHSGIQTCGQCEPGLLMENDKKADVPLPNKGDLHKMELSKLKKKFGISGHQQKINLGKGYTDRAQERRETVGSQNEHEKTQVASVDESIRSDNKGFKMLSKMGWTQGQSLGKHGEGLLEPVQVNANSGTVGMGAQVAVPPPVVATLKEKQKLWKKAQERYKNLPEASPALELEDMFS